MILFSIGRNCHFYFSLERMSVENVENGTRNVRYIHPFLGVRPNLVARMRRDAMKNVVQGPGEAFGHIMVL